MILARLAIAGLATLAAGAGAAGQSRPVAYCDIPSGTGAWAFHAGTPISGASGSYARGHGTISGNAVQGVACQVDRVKAGATDRQIVMSVGPRLVSHESGVVVGGVVGREMVAPVRVTASTDASCKVGSRGRLTLFNSFNGTHGDSAQFSFAGSCRRHRHTYIGATVTVIVPA
jgi:hypothetical protein